MKTIPSKLTGWQQEWLTHLRRAEARNMPLAQYCRAQGLSVQTLYNARYELKHQKARRLTASMPAKQSRSTHSFVAVQLAPSPAVPAAACRVQLKDVVIECASLPPSAWLVGLATGAPHAMP